MAELLVSVGENGGGVGSLRDAKELFGKIVRAPWRRRERRRKQLILLKKGGGGAGICTRVRKYIPAGLYDAYPPLWCRA